MPELLTWYKQAYKQDYIIFYAYKNGKMIPVKDAKGKNAELAVFSNAAGRYEVYACSRGHLHTDWNGGWMGTEDTAYIVKNGKLQTYCKSTLTSPGGKKTYSLNGKKVSKKKYDSEIKKCKGKTWFKKNTKGNRSKYLK